MRQTHLTDQTFQQLEARRARLQALWRMTPTQRVAAMRRGELSLEQCAAWAARYPEEVPQINGEYEYLAAFTPEVQGIRLDWTARASRRPASVGAGERVAHDRTQGRAGR
jgi:hypothetical protein